MVVGLATPAAIFSPYPLSHIVLNLLGIALGVYLCENSMFATLLEDASGGGFISMGERTQAMHLIVLVLTLVAFSIGPSHHS